MQSYSFTNKQKNLLEFSPHFATLIDELEEEYIFEFVFRISQVAIVKKFLSRLVVKCVNPNVFVEKNSSVKKLSSSPPQKKAIVAQLGKSEIENILFKHTRQIKQAIAKENSVITEGVANLQNYVEPNVAKSLLSGRKAAEIEQMYSYIDSLELVNNEYELPSASTISQNEVRKVNLDLISNFLLHPMEAVNYQTDIDIVNSIRKYYTYDALQSLPREKAYYKSAKKKKLVDKVSIPVYLAIPKRLVQGSFEIQLEILKFERNKKAKLFISEVPVERKITTINLAKHLKFFKQPIARPVLEAPTEDTPEVIATQKDANSNYLRIEKKEMNNRGDCTRYTIACEALGLVVGENSSITEAVPDNKFNIFRCVSGDAITTMLNPRVDGIISGQVIPVDTTTLIVTDKLNIGISDAIEITIKYPPAYASQFQISRSTWDGSSFDKKEVIIPYRDFDGDSTLVVDDLVKNGYIYEYFLSYKTLTGEIRQSISRIHQYFKISNKGISVSIDSPAASIVAGRPALKFNIFHNQLHNSERIADLAAQQLISSKDTLETSTNSKLDKLDDLIYHKVARINLKTGIREFFSNITADFSLGVNSNQQFLNDDPDNRKKHGIEDLDLTTDYLYEVRTYARNPSTMIKGLVHQVKLPPASAKSPPKIYSYKPHKWRQPSYLESGTIPAQDEQDNIVMKRIDEDGEVGITATYLLTGMNKLLMINSFTAERVDANKVRLSWGLTGDMSEFDHFVVVKEVNKTRNLLGAVIGQELFDFLGPNDLGTIIYYAIPVLYDFSAGVATRSNALVIDPEELHFKQQVSEK
jgi:hypothetical protein